MLVKHIFMNCDQILQNRSKSHIRQNQTNTTSGWLHYHTTSFDTQYYSNYSRPEPIMLSNLPIILSRKLKIVYLFVTFFVNIIIIMTVEMTF